jgi:hypothetical protein
MIDNKTIKPLFLAESCFHLFQPALVKLWTYANTVGGFPVSGT